MKLNKRECRKFADPDLQMPPGNGILHAKQIDYIIRTAVKIIDHHKTLILYVYPRGQAAQGDFRPEWTMFHNRDDFITLARREDGSTTWRTAAFERLGDSWDFISSCAFYSAKDEERLCSYFKSDPGNGFASLVKAQVAIQGCRWQERQCIREGRIIKRMASIPALPRGLKTWIHKSVMPAYFFYDYKRGGMNVPGVCSSCGREIRLSGVKQGNKATCPHCRRELIMKPRSRRGYNMYDRDTCQVIQNTGDGGLVIRIIKVYYTYTSDMPDVQIYENARQFVWLDFNGKVCAEHYYYDYNSGIRTDWRKGIRPAYMYQYNFEADVRGHVYGKNLPDALQGTPWQYCPIDTFYEHFHEPMQALPFLSAHLKNPRVEHFVKTGFYAIAADLAYGYSQSCLDQTQNRTHRILQIAAEDVAFLRDLDVDLSTLQIFQEYAGLKDRQKLLVWQIENEVRQDIRPILKHMTVHKAVRYLDEQYEFLRPRKTPYGTMRYKGIQDLVTDWRVKSSYKKQKKITFQANV